VPDIVTGRVNLAGQLVSADLRLSRLQERAGGKIGEELAIPSIAGIVRLARTLGILISRSVISASGDHDLELLVRAKPDADGVSLTIGGWTPRAPRQPWLVPQNNPSDHRNSAATWTWVVDDKLRFLEAVGVGHEILVGQTVTDAFRLLENDRGGMPILDAALLRSDFVDQHAVLRSEPQQEVLLSGRVRFDQSGAFAGYAGVTRDAAELATGETLVAPIDSSFTEKLDMALRGPLSRIVASADSIGSQTEGPLRRDYADYAGDIASAARHLLALVDDLSDLQTIEQPDFNVEVENIDLADLARRAAGLLKVRAGDQQVVIDQPANDDVLSARGDFRRVLQILLNLIGNAIRYSPAGSTVTIGLGREGDDAIIVVADQGKGIDPADQVRIFEKFERVDPSEPGGSGLGLFISRRLAQAMGGDIAVDSAPGQGARFVLSLPAA
jgi:signal transduction histidine kinase